MKKKLLFGVLAFLLIYFTLVLPFAGVGSSAIQERTVNVGIAHNSWDRFLWRVTKVIDSLLPDVVYASTTPDYVVDGTADNVEIQTAISALSSGGTVMLSEGTFNIAAAIELTDYIRLSGQGYATLLNANAGLNANMLHAASGETNVEIDHIRLDGNGASQSSGYPIQIEGDASRIHNNWVEDGYGQYGIVCDAGSRHQILYNYCEAANIYLANGIGTISYNIIYNANDLDGDAALVISNAPSVICEGNNIYTANKVGIIVSGVSSGGLIVGNYVYDVDDTDGVGIQIHTSNYTMVIGNKVILAAASNSNGGIQITNTTNHSSVVGNYILNSIVGIWCDGDYNLIANNDCVDNGLNRQQYGIRVYTSSSSNIVQGNKIYNTTAQAIYDQGANNVIKDNTGWTTENYGTGTISNGTTSEVVAHGLSATPTVVHFMATENSTNAIGIWWWTANTTDIVFNVANDPGASNLDFTWGAKVR